MTPDQLPKRQPHTLTTDADESHALLCRGSAETRIRVAVATERPIRGDSGHAVWSAPRQESAKSRIGPRSLRPMRIRALIFFLSVVATGCVPVSNGDMASPVIPTASLADG